MSQLKEEEKDRFLRIVLEKHTRIAIRTLDEVTGTTVAGAEKTTPGKTYKVVVKSYRRKIGLIHSIRRSTGASLPQAKDMVELGTTLTGRLPSGRSFTLWPAMGVMADSLSHEEAVAMNRSCQGPPQSKFNDGTEFEVLETTAAYKFPGPTD
jgi:hypothetical protein